MVTYVCINKCFHGRIWRPGEAATKSRLEKYGKVPEHFKKLDSKKSIDDQLKHAKRVSDLKAELQAFGAEFDSKCENVEELEELLKSAVASRRGDLGPIADPLK